MAVRLLDSCKTIVGKGERGSMVLKAWLRQFFRDIEHSAILIYAYWNSDLTVLEEHSP